MFCLEEYIEETGRLKLVIHNPELPFRDTYEAWKAWCKLFDEKEAAEAVQADACKGYEL